MRPKFVMFWTLFSTAFVVVLPTLINTMIGYAPRRVILVEFPDRQKEPYSSNATLMAELQQHGNLTADWKPICLAADDSRFQWGFSSLLMAITWYTFGVWIFGTYLAWLDARYHSELVRKERIVDGPLRAVVDLAEVVKEAVGPNTTAYSGEALQRELNKKGRVMYTTETNKVRGLGKIKLTARNTGKKLKLDWNTEYGEERF